MTPEDIRSMTDGPHTGLGAVPEIALVPLCADAAAPHGTVKPQVMREGESVLMDGGASVHGYQSGISRTVVVGPASAEQRKVWDQMHEGQRIAFETARVGVPAGRVDDAVRAQYEKW